MTAENYQLKRGKIFFGRDSPMELVEEQEAGVSQLTEEDQRVGRQVTGAVKAYLNAAGELLAGQYAHIKEWAPPHLHDSGNVLVVAVRLAAKAQPAAALWSAL